MKILKKTYELVNGDKVAEDVCKGNMLLVKAGASIDVNIKRKLQKWEVSSVYTTVDSPGKMASSDTGEDNPKDLFYELLRVVVNETRYGYALHSEENIKWLEKAFISNMSDPFVYEELMKLKKWDIDSFHHAFDVFLLGSLLYKKIGKKHREIELFAQGCLLHDIGKANIPQAVLQKKGPLTSIEFEVIKQHPLWGSERIKAAGKDELIASMARFHHEKLDGSGYPEQLLAKDIIPDVRILTIIDMYSALTMKRCYRSPFEIVKALKLLFGERHKIDQDYLVEFIDMLGVYPPHTIVELSDGTRAEVLHVYERMPYMPIVKRLDNLQTIELPSNLSLKVSRFLFK